MNWKTILLPIALKILRVALTALGASIGGFLVARHLITDGDKLTLVNILADSAPVLLGALPGAALQIWVWLNTFAFITKLETVLHLPVTGRPSVGAIRTAASASDLATNLEAFDRGETVSGNIISKPPQS